MKMNTPASLVILLPVWLCICTCPACPADRTEPYYQSFTTCKAWKLRSHAPSSFYTFYTFYTDSTQILHHVSVQSGCQGLSIFGRSRPEGKTTWGGRDSCDIMRWRPRTAERNDNERAIQCRPTAERNDNDSGKLKWDLKSLEVAKKTQEFRLTKTIEDSCCVQVEKLKAEAVMFQCARCIDSVLVREKPSATRFRRVSVDGVEWLYR